MVSPPLNLIRWPALKQKLGGLGRSTIDRWEKSNGFPKRIVLGDNFVAWDESLVDEWIKNRK
jgi:predicted DNA-binding transcriptional regulator AlpA